MIVYWVRIAEIGRTKSSQPHPEVDPPNMPLLLTVRAKTSPTVAWRSGTRKRIAITAAAPATCHHTEMLLITASRWLEKMLMTATTTRMIRNIANTRRRL